MSAELRAKRIIALYGRLLAVLLLIVGVAAIGGAGFVYTNVPTQTITEDTQVQQVQTSVQTRAVVTGDTDLYEEGETLVNQPVYITNATPTLTITVQTSVPDSTDVTVEHRLTLRQTASRNGISFWNASQTLIAVGETTDDGTVRTETTVDMDAISRQVASNREQLEEFGQFETVLLLNVTYDTGEYKGSLTASTPLTINERAYWLGDTLGTSRTHSTPVTSTTKGEPNVVLAGILALLGGLAFAAAGWVSLVKRRGIDLEAVELELDRVRFEEWITTGELPTDPDKKYIRTTTLEGLVDIAIDSNKRVIYDPDQDVYTVVTDDLVYYYAPTETDIGSWFNL